MTNDNLEKTNAPIQCHPFPYILFQFVLPNSCFTSIF